MELLPKSYGDFKSKEYWDSFFKTRGTEAFEWYGCFDSIFPSFRLSIPAQTARILIIGCGNSDFSSRLYDAGYENIVNIDFSDVVIEEMKEKCKSQPKMQWLVGDVTQMADVATGAFDVVFDKGTLDAILSTDDTAPNQSTESMFHEIRRVLQPEGLYLCVSLAQDFVTRKLVSFFDREKIEMWPIVSSAPSPFLTLLISVNMTRGEVGCDEVSYFFSPTGDLTVTSSRTNKENLADMLQAVQRFVQRSFELGTLKVGRFEVVEFWASALSGLPANIAASIPRFSITIIDVANRGKRDCAVFFIPTGRETDFQFSSQQGLSAIAASAECCRLLAVRCNKPHVFESSNSPALQNELSPIVMKLAPMSCRQNPRTDAIPFMALSAENAWRVIASGSTPVNGSYTIEEDDSEEHDGRVLRRLLFLQNQNFVQTEVRLAPHEVLSSKLVVKSSGKKAKPKAKSVPVIPNQNSSSPGLIFDWTYADDHHKSVLVGLLLMPHFAEQISSIKLKSTLTEPNHLDGAVIGLGGGAIGMLLQQYVPNGNLILCDLDESLLGLAEGYFGFVAAASTSIVFSDGVRMLQNLECSVKKGETSSKSSLDYIFIDVDCKDPSLAITAPPEEFVTNSMIDTMLNCLKPSGLLIFNVVARGGPSVVHCLVERIKTVLEERASEHQGEVYSLKASSETVNETIFVLRCPKESSVSVASKKPLPKKSSKGPDRTEADLLDQRMERLVVWLKNVGLSTDPLQLKLIVPLLRKL